MIELYINGQLCDLTDDPQIQFTYQSTDYSEPTAVKNSFTKTITLPSTERNDLIFSHIKDMRRTQHFGNSKYFNPSQRCPFVLYKDGAVVEKGYMKLDNIAYSNHIVSYQITLYGGLSQFLFSLSYDADGNQRKLSDLTFLHGGDDELDFKITKDTVKEAWDSIENGSTGGKWGTVNFAVCYEGYPENFDSDKCVVNTYGADYQVRQAYDDRIHTQKLAETITETVDGETVDYKSTNGYLYGDLMRNQTGLEMRDLRSYLQRPVLNVKSLIKAICDPVNNGGYEVVLDPKFFKDANPYWSKTWITLPAMTGLDSETTSEDYNWELGSSVTTNAYDTVWSVNDVSVVTSSPSSYTFQFNLSSTVKNATEPNLYLNAGDSLGGIALQVYGVDTEGKAVCGSNVYVLTNRNAKGATPDYNGMINTNGYVPAFYSGVSTVLGSFVRQIDGTYKWSSTLSLRMDTSEAEPESIKLRINYLPYGWDGKYWHSGPQRKYVYPSISDTSTHYSLTASITDRGGKIGYEGGESATHTGTLITKNMLLSGLEGTPADWLLSFTKAFGLYMVKDRWEDKIYIYTRASYYNRGEYDIERDIDRSREMRVDPLTFNTKWYSMYGDEVRDRSEKESEYVNRWGTDFGKQLIDTQYNFDVQTTEMMKSSKFKPGLAVLEKSNWFTEMQDGDYIVPSAFHNWVTLHYKSGDDELEVNTGYPATAETHYFDDGYSTYYDVMPKLQLHSADNQHIERSGTLLFLNGMDSVRRMRIWLTDDTATMYSLNDRTPCWLVTSSATDRKGNTIAIPVESIPCFSRYTEDTGNISNDLDYGRTKELFIPQLAYSGADTTIYEKYWKSYVEDLYSVNTRVVECHIDHHGREMNQDWLRRFYTFDNSLWVMTKIDSYDISSPDPVKCTFTKVNDKAAYLGDAYLDDYYFKVTREGSDTDIPASGNTTAVFDLWSDGDWRAYISSGSEYVYFDDTSPYVTSGTGDRDVMRRIKVVFYENKTETDRKARIDFVRTDGKRITKWLNQKGLGVYTPKLTVTPDTVYVPRNSSSWSAKLVVESTSAWNTMKPSSGDWATLSATSGASGTTEVTVTATVNDTGNERRTGVRFINDEGMKQFVKIIQPFETRIQLIRDDSHMSIPQTGGTAFYKVISDQPWTLVTEGDWRQDTTKDWSWDNSYAVPDILSGTGDDYISVEYKVNNTTLTRTPRFYISYGSNTSAERVWERNGDYGTQKAKINSRPPMPPDPGNPDNPTPVDPPSGEDYTKWEAWTDETWIHLVEPTSGTGTANVRYWLDRNTGALRKGYIYVRYTYADKSTRTETIEIIQNGDSSTNPLTVNPDTVNTTYNDRNTHEVIVTAPCAWEIASKPDWVTDVVRTDNGFTFKVQTNDSQDSRTGTITITSCGETATVTVNQTGDSTLTTYLRVDPHDITFNKDGGTAKIRVESNQSWTVTMG